MQCIACPEHMCFITGNPNWHQLWYGAWPLTHLCGFSTSGWTDVWRTNEMVPENIEIAHTWADMHELFGNAWYKSYSCLVSLVCGLPVDHPCFELVGLLKNTWAADLIPTHSKVPCICELLCREGSTGKCRRWSNGELRSLHLLLSALPFSSSSKYFESSSYYSHFADGNCEEASVLQSVWHPVYCVVLN